MLVVGVQNPKVLKGRSKSTKHRKAERLAAEGSNIQIITESDFIDVIEAASPDE